MIMVGRTTAMRTTTTPSSPLRPSPSSDASRRSSPGAVAVVVQTDDGGDGAKARAAAAAAAAKEEDEAVKKRTRETCESVVAWIRGVAVERGRTDEPVRYAKGEGLAHRARLLKFRVRTARVRMQPRRPRRAPGRGTAVGSEGGGEDDNAAANNGGVDGSRRGMRRVNSLVALATRNDRNNNAGAGSKDGTSSADAALGRGYASDSGSGYGSGAEETSSAISDLLALLEHAPYHHESLEDEKRPRGWTGSGSTMSRTGIIRVGVDHQACVPEGVLDSFKRGKMSDREKFYLGARVWPPPTTTTTRVTKQRKKKQTTTRTVDDDGNSPRRQSRILSAETCDNTGEEKEQAVEEQPEQLQPVFTTEEIAASRAALVERLRDDGADDSLLGLCAIGAEQGAIGWEEDEIRLFGEHVSRFCDDLFPLRRKIPGKSMRDIVNFYYNVWQTDFNKHGRVDVDGADKPAPREARAKRGSGGAMKALAGGPSHGGGSSDGQAQKNKDVRTIRSFLEWIRGVAMNPKRAMHNVHRAPVTARNKGEIMTRWRSTHKLPGVDEYLSDLSARAEASKFTSAEMKSAREKKKTTTTNNEMDSDKTDSAYDSPQRPHQQKRRASSSNEKDESATKRRAPTKETK